MSGTSGAQQALRRQERSGGPAGEGIAATVSHGRSLPILLLPILTLAWAMLMSRFQGGGVYWSMGLYAVGVMAVLALAFRSTLRGLLRPTLRDCLIGVGVGAAMTAATYPAYRLASHWFPALPGHVSELYAASRQEPVLIALAWVVAILAAEEVLWRAAWVDALSKHVDPRAAAAISVLLYAAAQLGSGSWLVGLLAACCGTIWTVLRMWRRSLWPPLLAHVIWTPVVILLRPLS